MISPPIVDGRRVESFFQELRRFAPHYTPDLNISDAQSAGVALMRIFAQVAEIVAVRLDQAPQKHFVAFLDKLGITLLPARPATAAVTFRLASGFEEAVRVPVGTRVTAPGEEGEIPFETTNELLAIPGVLTAVYGVDPSQDFIFRPPLGFLKQEPRTPTELKYTVQSFVPAQADRLQLDHTTELAPDSFVLIGCKEKAIILKVDDGGFVTLYNPVKQNFAAGTIVVPIRDFEVFNGIDIQEHVLYLGHSDIFTVKEEIEIKLEVELKDAQPAGFGPLKLVWQFWTKNEDAVPEEEEHWQNLTVKTDRTNGFSTSGEIVLVKPPKLEIKPRAVGGTDSRWIRAQLLDKLPVGGPPLPEVETIKVGVNTRVDATAIPPKPIGIPADQGFYNATPLDVQVDPGIGFFPFGAEPRQFDQFYIASKEAFSKREANVSLNFDLDLQTLASPSLVNSNLGLRAYSIGLRRRLFELDVPGASFNILGSPESQGSSYVPVAGSVPSAITDLSDGIFVFVTTADSLTPQDPTNKIWVHFHKSNQATGTWTDIDAPDPAGKKVKFSPAAVRLSGWQHFSRVFVVGADDKLYSRGYPGGTSWDSHGSPGGKLESPPFVLVAGAKVFVFICGEGTVHWLTLNNDSNLTAQWKSLKPNNQSFTAIYRPFAQSFVKAATTHAKVFAFAFEKPDDKTTGKLFETDTSQEDTDGKFPWENLDQPNADEIVETAPEAHAPVGYLEDPTQAFGEQGTHIFLRGADKRLYERIDDAGGNPQWKDRTRPGDPALRGSPAVYVDPPSGVIPGATTTLIHLVAASGRNSIVAWDFEQITINLPSSLSPEELGVLLDRNHASPRSGDYVGKDLEIIQGSGQGKSKRIIAYDGALALTRLVSPITPLPDSTSVCQIDGANLGNARGGGDSIFAIHVPVTDSFTAKPLYLRIDNVFIPLNFYSRVTGMISLIDKNDFPPLPAVFNVHSEVVEGPTEYLSPEDTGTVPQLSWEFWNGTGWLSIRKVVDKTNNLLKSGEVTFVVPKEIEATEVAGQENYWIRARLVAGDYGRETFKVVPGPGGTQIVVSEKSSLRPPKVRQLLISYQASPVAPQACLTFNNLNYLDQTAACEAPDSHFPPFERLDEKSLTLFFGFDKTFKTGPVRLLLDAVERNIDDTRPPEFEWSFRKDRIWKKLDAEDGSVALTRQGILTISAADELTNETRFGKSLFWIKGSFRLDRNLSEAEYPRPLLRGIFLNTVQATQGETITEEIVGSGDGEPNQTHAMQHGNVLEDEDNVLENEDIRIQEALSTEERERIERELGKASVVDRQDIGGTWVRWKEVKALFDSGDQDRHYEIDRAAGILKFGDGEHGRVVPAGVDNIRAFSYRTGGGAIGNVQANKIEALSTAVAGIESVFNPTPAGGGSDQVDTNEMLTIGPRRISHRDRAVSDGDFEELALEASRQVAKVRCLRTTNLVRSGNGKPDPCDPRQLHEALNQRGFVSLIIVPDSTDPRPCPSLELRRTVKKYLSDRAPTLVAAGDGERIVVRPPDFVIVAVYADIFVSTLEKAAAVETQARTKLEEFLHPVHGGPDGTGWDFGRPLSKSDVFAILERIADVDRVEGLSFNFRGQTNSDRVQIGPNELIASGEHKLSIKKA